MAASCLERPGLSDGAPQQPVSGRYAYRQLTGSLSACLQWVADAAGR